MSGIFFSEFVIEEGEKCLGFRSIGFIFDRKIFFVLRVNRKYWGRVDMFIGTFLV